MANIITGSRIILSLALLLCPTFSTSFYIIYIIAGFTDMIDGTIAFLTNKMTNLGARLDTIADFVLVVVCFIKLYPMLDIPHWLYVWITIIAVNKLINLVVGYVMYKGLITWHSLWNKLAGLLLFIIPFTIKYIDIKYSGVVVCLVASYAAMREFLYIVIVKFASDNQ